MCHTHYPLLSLTAVMRRTTTTTKFLKYPSHMKFVPVHCWHHLVRPMYVPIHHRCKSQHLVRNSINLMYPKHLNLMYVHVYLLLNLNLYKHPLIFDVYHVLEHSRMVCWTFQYAYPLLIGQQMWLVLIQLPLHISQCSPILTVLNTDITQLWILSLIS